jgi:hypothetical protein
MGICDPRIEVVCDGAGCMASDEFGLCPLAGGGWDDRYLEGELESNGWKLEGGRWLCPDCLADGEFEDEAQDATS